MFSLLQKLSIFIFVVLCSCVLVKSTDVRVCPGNKPAPLDVRVFGCDASPCDIIKGETTIFEIDFVTYTYITKATTLVRATTLGLTVPYELPDEVRDVCPNLMYGAYCPLYPTEDVTYLFVFPIGNYPEISVKIEISIVDQDNTVVACFVCDIKVKKGNSGGGSGGSKNATSVYELDWKI